MYENCRIVGIYQDKKDRRYRISLQNLITKKYFQTSYPKYLIECSLNRKLEDFEHVHHIDDNVENNLLSNLEVLRKEKHWKHHGELNKIQDIEISCVWCGKSFKIEGKKIRERFRKAANGFCSKECIGEYGKAIQLGNVSPFSRIEIKRIKKKDI